MYGLPGDTAVKDLPASAGDARNTGLIPESGRSLGGRNANHSSILALKVPWTEGPGWLQSMGSQNVRHDCECMHTHTHMHQTIVLKNVGNKS